MPLDTYIDYWKKEDKAGRCEDLYDIILTTAPVEDVAEAVKAINSFQEDMFWKGMIALTVINNLSILPYAARGNEEVILLKRAADKCTDWNYHRTAGRISGIIGF